MRNVLLQLAIIGFFSVSALAQTTIGDSTITTGTTIFYKSKSPYVLNGTINVKFRGKLVVQPGVTLIIDKATQLLVEGTLLMTGTAVDSIRIKPQNTSVKSDFSIQRTLSGCKLKLSYLNISYFNSLCNSTGYDGDTISNAYISNCNIGIGGFTFVNSCFITNCDNGIANIGSLNVTDTQIKYCGNGLIIKDGLWLYNSEISNNLRGVLDKRNRGQSMTSDIRNNKINNNRLGIQLYSSVGTDYGHFKFIDNEIIANDTGVVCFGENNYFNQFDMIAGTKICSNKIYNLVYSELYKDISISKVCWCTNDSLQIRKKIYDGYTNNSDIGYVTFPGYLKDCAITDGIADTFVESEENLVTVTANTKTVVFKYEIDDFEIFGSNGVKIDDVLSISKLVKQVNSIETGGLFVIRYKYNNRVYTKKVFIS